MPLVETNSLPTILTLRWRKFRGNCGTLHWQLKFHPTSVLGCLETPSLSAPGPSRRLLRRPQLGVSEPTPSAERAPQRALGAGNSDFKFGPNFESDHQSLEMGGTAAAIPSSPALPFRCLLLLQRQPRSSEAGVPTAKEHMCDGASICVRRTRNPSHEDWATSALYGTPGAGSTGACPASAPPAPVTAWDAARRR